MSRLAASLASDGPFALYRIPGEEVQLIDTLPQKLPQLRNFLFAPFRSESEPEIRLENGSWSIVSKEELIGSRLILSGEPGPGSPETKNPGNADFDAEKWGHIKLINKALEEIHAKALLKVVLARQERRNLPPGFDLLTFFRQLSAKYPSAFVYLLRLPDGNFWTGASPELLIRAREGLYSTVALAGTRRSAENRPWTGKEQLEQAIVSDYLRGALHAAGAQEIQETGPFEAEAGHLRHLKSVFHFKASLSPETLARKLHPTPAVAGIPQQAAMEFIDANETHSRGYYAGFLGPFDAENADFYVNLRCASLFHTTMSLYAGGGILEGSDPEAEFEETLYKMQTVWSVVENS